MGKVYRQVLEFKRKYPMTVGWRLKQNAAVVELHLNPDEEVVYTFCGQKNDRVYDLFGTAVITLTNKRILIGRKRVLFGYFLNSITPDLFNDLNIRSGLIWGKVNIETVKELITISNIAIDALQEIETNISTYMIEKKKEYFHDEKEK